MKKILFFLITALHLSNLFAQKTFEWTPLAKDAYQKTIQTRFVEAEQLIRQLKQEEPDNYIVYHIENYIDFFKIFMDEDAEEFKKLKKNKDFRLEKIEEEGDKNSPYYLFLQADIRLQWAFARLKFEEYTTAFFEVNKAFKLLKKNIEKFPDFLPNQKDIGILHAMVGTIPGNYKWGVKLLTSMEGTINQGQKELERVIQYAQGHPFIYDEEVTIFYAYLLLHLGNDSKKSWQTLQSDKLDHHHNPMLVFVKANVAMRTGRNEKAIELLENRPAGRKYHPFPYLNYMLGTALLQKLDGHADIFLKTYLATFKGKNFLKDTWRKLAWHALIFRNKVAYRNNIQNCITEGYNVVGADKSALKEAQSNEIPDVRLLKARLLFDGGYYQRAYKELTDQQLSELASEKTKLEYEYRLGRILHKMKKYDEALLHYQETIDNGSDLPWYFACRAALETGHIYEKLHNFAKAKTYYELCIDIDPEEYKTGLHQQAKTGLERIGE